MFSNLKLSTKLLLTFVPAFLALIAGSYFLNNRTQEDAMLEQAKTTAIQRAHIVREALVSQMVDKYKVDDAFLARLQQVGGLEDLFIWINVDNLHFTEDLIDSARIARLTARMNAALAKGDEGLPVFKTGNALFIQREDDMEAIVPFKAEKKCLACHSVEIGHVLGVAHISVPITDIKAAIQSNSQQTAIITATFALVILVLGYSLFRRLVQKPVKDLLVATEAISQGNLGFESTVSHSNDELGVLSQSFDTMRKALRQSQDALRTSTVGQIAFLADTGFQSPPEANRFIRRPAGHSKPSTGKESRVIRHREEFRVDDEQDGSGSARFYHGRSQDQQNVVQRFINRRLRRSSRSA